MNKKKQQLKSNTNLNTSIPENNHDESNYKETTYIKKR